ncbi:nucleotide sugar dehydrogenase [Planococcus maritimus]|uniref:Nucleotide sugar dehydrogenase n=1 Tax=Planococcus maritimus TaxID=192421 RepID=A0A7D7MAC9_PLAMR|nr:nucleotide sugar dehydrogenase [Planococcus maritimus]QMT16755.1 nucleotide sugar dehydrogenase [Planococcus maritimus]
MDKINVIGLGYIGLPTALMLAKSGLKVTGTDYNKDIINSLQNGELLFDEEGLNELYEQALQNEINFSSSYVKADVYILAVPTPYVEDNKKLDASFVISAINSVLDICDKGTAIVIESTISPGTIDKYIRPVVQNRGLIMGQDIHLLHAPERIIPGNMIFELENNARTIGADNNYIAEKVKNIYKTFCKAEIVITDIRSAEMSKVVENTYRDVNIAFANELAKICRQDDMDVYEIIRIANKHPRVNILQPGPGVGGHCISVDPWFLVGDYPDLTRLILSARKINDSMPNHVLKRIADIMKKYNINDISKVGLYGLTYKENVDDTRESPTLQLLNKMEEHLSFGIKVFDPLVSKKIVENQVMNFEEFLEEIEIVVILVAHQHLIEHMDLLGKLLILDTKNICMNSSTVYKL